MSLAKLRNRFAIYALCSGVFVLFESCVPTSEGYSGVAIGGGGINSNSVESYAPTDFAATPNSTTQINLTWTDTSSGRATYVLERSTDGTTFTEVATPAAGETSYSDVGLSSGITYSYRIKAVYSGASTTYKTASTAVAAASTWTAITTAPPGATGTMFLLSDGTVMAQRAGVSKIWYKLTPNSQGSYINGTWSVLTSMSLERLYYSSRILPDGKVFIAGGEYSGALGAANWINSGEIYNPVTNTWTSITDVPTASYGDIPSSLLPDGRVIVGDLFTDATFIYTPSSDSWVAGPDKLYNDRSCEETFIRLADESILSYNIWGSAKRAQRYVPSLNAWYDAGLSPVQLHNAGMFELGNGMLMHNGKVLLIGATGHTGLYTPPTTATGSGSWVAGPDVPNSLGANDAPTALLPNGHMVIAAGDADSFDPPTELSIYDPTANTITAISTPGAMSLSSKVAYVTRMLMLPTGQMLFATGSSLWFYTSYGQPNPGWRPTITSVVSNGGSVYTLTGTQINGMSEGSGYGDDAENSTNYPIVKIVDSSGVVRYARTHDWSSNGIQTGSTPVTTKFTLPAGITSGSGTYSLYVIGSGISSLAYTFTP